MDTSNGIGTGAVAGYWLASLLPPDRAIYLVTLGTACLVVGVYRVL